MRCTALGAVAYLVAFSFAAFLLAFIFNGVGLALSSGALDAWFVDCRCTPKIPTSILQPPLARAVFTLATLGVGTLVGSAMPLLFNALPPEGTAVLTPFTTTLIASLVVHLIAFAATTTFSSTRIARQGDVERLAASLRARCRNWLPMPSISAAATPPSASCWQRRCSAAGIISLELLWQPHFADLLWRQ